MSQVIVVPSVHHTGTKFVYRHLLEGLEDLSASSDTRLVDYGRKPFYGKVRIHIDAPLVPRLKVWMSEFPSILPLRHPRKVAVSWKVREKRLSWLTEQWRLLKEEIFPLRPWVLPLDTEQRDERLRSAAEAIGFPMSTDWPLVCADGRTTELTEEDERHVQDVMADGFFAQFGYAP